MRTFLLLCLTCLQFSATAQDTLRTFLFGDSAVSLVVHRSDKPGPLFFNMHDDENTCVEAAKAELVSSGGTLYELQHSGDRYIHFSLDTVSYAIDPNRIYTAHGVWRELRRVFVQDSTELADSLHRVHRLLLMKSLALLDVPQLSGDTLFTQLNTLLDRWRIKTVLPPFAYTVLDSQAYLLVHAFADSLISVMKVDTQNLVIALHNNKENGYSMVSYLVDSIYAQEALAVYRSWHPDPDDFYFVTDRAVFEALQPNLYHIVLQDNARVTDDGSLSVYCAMHGVRYVNVEAQHGHLGEQEEMLRILVERLLQ